jgi:hypothetical protein
VLAAVGIVVAATSHQASSPPRHTSTSTPGAAIVSNALCDPLPKAGPGTTRVGLNGAFDLKHFAASPMSIGQVGETGLRAAGFVGGCASTASGPGYTSDRELFTFGTESGAVKFGAYTFANIVPELATVASPTGPDTVSGISGSLFESYFNDVGEADIGFAVRGHVATEVAVVGTTVDYNPFAVFEADLTSMARNLTGRSAQVTLEDTRPDVSGPVRPVVLDTTSPGVSVDLAEATTVTRLLWQYRQVALNVGDVKALALVEDGPLLAIDRGLCATSCATEQKIGDVVAYSPIVALQTDWPATFLASVVYSGFCGQLCVDTFVAVQQRRGAPWLLSLYVGYSGQVPIETSESGAASWAQPPAPPTGAPLNSVEASYARYLQTLQSTGRPPRSDPFAKTFFSDSQTLKNLGIPADGKDAEGVSRTTTFRAGPKFHDEFGVDFGLTAVCGTYTWTTTVVPPAGKVLSQPADRSAFGALLTPGAYVSVAMRGVGMVCFDISPSAGAPVYPVGALDGVVSATGAAG